MTLESAMEAIIDYRGKSPQKTSSGIPLITARVVKGGRILPPDEFIAPEDYDEWMRRGLPLPGDVLITTEAPLGEVAQIDHRKVALAQRIIALRGKEGILDNTFLKFLLQSAPLQAALRSRSTGTTVSGIRQSELRQVLLPIPPFEEQRTIANILGTMDDKIELNRKMNETLEALARALFKSWFVDFDPVRARVDGRDPGLPTHIADLFPASFEDSELIETPRGWTVGSLADYAALNPENWSKDTRPDDIKYVDLTNTKWGRIETITNYSEEEGPSRAQRILRPGDSIVGTVRPGNGSYAFIDVDGLTGSTGFAVLRPYQPEHREFVYLTATRRENIASLAHLADGGAYPAVRPDAIAASPAVIPGKGVLACLSRVIAPIMAKVSHGERENSTLTALRDTLLPKLISGELKVADAKRILGGQA
jgi:type I restriction enzyme S subunit